ncbi:hypothetical protein QCB44_04145 [Thiomicrorhabdus sp. zzn3]|uniref:5-carboxymethyl-2-hydroxymuconate Delta-isomerase n=1 Tax=Thiomicrorhabdus sp. zzn3 TaxID=3039775 RepID=UPI00243697F7|nr:hypothetical protein [Thiomicrorhabdus sp. zzn3]MDG6777896.1 hypothetical protein [Thiomicrorhabdus sp. zzn3]
MPHIIIEYSQTSLCEEELAGFMAEAYEAVNSTQLFEEENIKLRLHPVTHFQLGLPDCGFIHAMCRIHIGKTEAEKKHLSKTLLAAIKRCVKGRMVITVEVMDMDRLCYAKTITAD